MNVPFVQETPAELVNNSGDTPSASLGNRWHHTQSCEESRTMADFDPISGRRAAGRPADTETKSEDAHRRGAAAQPGQHQPPAAIADGAQEFTLSGPEQGYDLAGNPLPAAAASAPP